ncbi:hypothetical protein SORBI_3002G288100 [Sorghum bicolor]|uniref:Uncharacterized protein n=1 Tax=Sorghum bicolor TaxID=4558 RepID=A0A1B6QDZ5_SORBI|nr:hypothetical protein SORBI_3002G288100 [Sorghum bicolor]
MSERNKKKKLHHWSTVTPPRCLPNPLPVATPHGEPAVSLPGARRRWIAAPVLHSHPHPGWSLGYLRRHRHPRRPLQDTTGHLYPAVLSTVKHFSDDKQFSIEKRIHQSKP